FTAEEAATIRAFSMDAVERNEWSFSLGVSLRQISDLKLHAVSGGAGNYYNGSYDPTTGKIIVDDDGAQTTPTPGAPIFPGGSSFISLSSLDFQGSSEDASGNGIVLGLSKLLTEHDSGFYSLDFTLVTLFVDESFGLGDASKTDVFVGNGTNGDYTTPGGPIGGDDHPAALPGTAPGGFDIELSAFTFGLGASQHFVWDSGITLDFGAGPSLTIVSYDFEGPSISASGDLSSNSSSDVDFLFGLYAQANVGYEFNESWALVGGVRYDLIQEIEDDVADVDLSGLSFQIKAIYSF
ncbi:MAG: hypothetical protein KAG98_05315, partial [Lentisphaeria bacterium]|nr:hypothetical protein [Lentisphaeria bacterium]